MHFNVRDGGQNPQLWSSEKMHYRVQLKLIWIFSLTKQIDIFKSFILFSTLFYYLSTTTQQRNAVRGNKIRNFVKFWQIPILLNKSDCWIQLSFRGHFFHRKDLFCPPSFFSSFFYSRLVKKGYVFLFCQYNQKERLQSTNNFFNVHMDFWVMF